MKNGIEFDRQVGSPRFQQVEITKKIDVASPYLFEKSCASDKALPQVIIHECRSQDSITPFAEYTLSNVLVSHYFSYGQTGSNTKESLRLSFTKLEMKVTNKGKPAAAGYDLEKSQSL